MSIHDLELITIGIPIGMLISMLIYRIKRYVQNRKHNKLMKNW